MNPQDPLQNQNGSVPPASQPLQQPYYAPPNIPQQPAASGPTVTPSPAHAYGPPVAGSEPPHAQYDFIMNPGQAPKTSILSGIGLSGGSTVKRAGVAAIGAMLLIIVIVLVASVLGGSKFNSTHFISVGQDQTELVRVATLATSDATSQPAQAVAYNVKLGITTSKQQLVAYLATKHVKISTNQLSLKQNTKTTTDLTNAVATSTFDSAFNDVMKSLLTTYIQDLKTAYNANPGPKGRVLLSQQYNGAELLLQQNAQASTTSN